MISNIAYFFFGVFVGSCALMIVIVLCSTNTRHDRSEDDEDQEKYLEEYVKKQKTRKRGSSDEFERGI